jgi:hypothetical protein
MPEPLKQPRARPPERLEKTLARATKDVDVGLPGDRAVRLREFESVLKLGFDQFNQTRCSPNGAGR